MVREHFGRIYIYIYRETIRWKWHFNKTKKPEEVDDSYTRKPWEEKTDKQAPVASDCPELEAFLAAVYKDLFDPALRKKIKSNISIDQRNFIKSVKTEYPNKNLRIRKLSKNGLIF